jgi:hypothetical protein
MSYMHAHNNLLRRDLGGKLLKAAKWRYQGGRPAAEFHTHVHSLLLRQDQNRRDHEEKYRMQALPQPLGISVASYHSSAANEKAVAIILGLGAVSAASYAASSGIKAYNEWKASLPEEPPVIEKEELNEEPKKEKEEEQEKGDRENIFAKWFGAGVGAKYYEGGFEEEMTRREAALILGVRESSSPARIKEAHRKLLVLNHPDTGGSTYIAGKLNEAKELLLKGKRM